MAKTVQPKTLEIYDLLDKGLTVEQAHAVVKPGRNLSRSGMNNIKSKWLQYSLTQPRNVQRASKVYDNALLGKPLTKNSEGKPTDTIVMQVAKEVMDRQHPKVTINQNLNVNIDLAPIDLDSYLIPRESP